MLCVRMCVRLQPWLYMTCRNPFYIVKITNKPQILLIRLQANQNLLLHCFFFVPGIGFCRAMALHGDCHRVEVVSPSFRHWNYYRDCYERILGKIEFWW
jgi:hypothetical protein